MKFIFLPILAVGIMICVFHSLAVKPGQGLSDTKLSINGGLGPPMDKLLGTSTNIFTIFHLLSK